MVQVLAMNIGQSTTGFTDVTDGLGLGNGPTTLHQIIQRFAFDIVHHIISRSVLLKDVEDADNIGMIQLKNGTGFLDELRLEPLNDFAIAFGRDGDMARLFISVTIVLKEKLLDGHFAIKHGILRQIGNTESTLTEHGDDFVLTSL